MAATLPTMTEAAARSAKSGNQPVVKARHAAAPVADANPAARTFARMKKLATFDPLAMKAAAGPGAP